MTDSKRLALAKAVFPERDVAENGLDGRTWITTIDGAPSPWVPFDPANNSEQAIAVLLWLHTIGEIEICRYCVGVSTFVVYPYNDVPAISIPHDGTSAGLRQAVTDAALMVARVKL